MKNTILSLAALVLAFGMMTATSYAGGNNPETGLPYGTAGCGLGSIAFGDEPGMMQILASTTNGTFGTQTFGISSGTSNCDVTRGGKRASLDNYIAANQVTLSNDAARGNGETIGGLAVVLGCEDPYLLGSSMKANYGKIFPSADVEVQDVSKAILETVHSDAILASQCSGRG